MSPVEIIRIPSSKLTRRARGIDAASRRSAVSCPSLNQPWISSSSRRASAALPRPAQRRREAGRGAQLPRLRFLRARDVERFAKREFGRRGAIARERKRELATKTVELRLPPAVLTLLDGAKRLIERYAVSL